MTTRRPRFLPLAFILALGACGDGPKVIPSQPPPPPPPPRPVLTIVSGMNASDTIESPLAQPLVVSVTRNGSPVAGARVTFATQARGPRVSTKPFETYAASADDTTGADGRASVRITLGTAAGPASVVVSVPAFELVDSARYTVRAGRAAPSTFRVEPLDTTVFVGATLKMRITAPDRFGNPTTDFSFQVYPGPSPIDGDSLVRMGPEVRRTNFVVHPAWGGAGTNVMVTIVPRDSMMIERYTNVNSVFRTSFMTMGLDGANVRTIDPETMQGTRPRWLADGRLLFSDTGAIRTMVPGSARVALIKPTADPGAVLGATPSRAGDWIFFIGLTSGRESLWRVRSDGTGMEKLAANILIDEIEPLPDGSGVLVIRDLGTSVQRFDLQTRAFTNLGFGANRIRISPRGDQLAYVAAGFTKLRVSNLDGTSARDIAPFAAADAQLNWTGDGQFLIAAVQSNIYGPNIIARYELVRVANGERLPLPFAVNGTNGYGEIAIRP